MSLFLKYLFPQRKKCENKNTKCYLFLNIMATMRKKNEQTNIIIIKKKKL